MGDAVQRADRVAVVTGGASGLGRAMGEACAAKGFDVALLDVDGERAAGEAAALKEQHGVRAIGFAVDVRQAGDVDAAAARVASELGGADLVFSNVGVQQFGAVEGFTDEAWRWVLDVNVVGAARVVRSFLPLLRASAQPRLAFTASSSVLSPASRLGAYQASKFAIMGLAETLRVELADDGIAVCVIFPSGMMTRHMESSLAARPDDITGDIADAADLEVTLASNPRMARHVTTAEVAAQAAVDAVLAGLPYVVTHGDLLADVVERHDLIMRAVEVARAADGAEVHQ